MMENTSREIVTNKLLIKNEFLKPPFDQLRAEKMHKYTQAQLIFSQFFVLRFKTSERKGRNRS